MKNRIFAFYFLLLNFFISKSLAALPACASGVTCPDGGIWSDWSTKESCSASCGSCARQYYTRTCLSTSADCPCTGDTSRYLLCNTHACTFPAQRTCCIPYVSMLINGSMQCGPFPKTTKETTKSCCPIGGFWSQWSAFSRSDDNTKWLKTRTCLSTDIGCACTGETVQTSTNCPCRNMVDVADQVRGSYLVYPVNGVVDQVACTFTGTIRIVEDANNNPCRGAGALVRYLSPPSNVVGEFRVLACNAKDLAGNNKVTFHCNMDTLYWETDYNNVQVTGWIQINIMIG